MLRGATIHTVTKGTITNGTIVLDRGKITAIGGADVAMPRGAKVVDVTGKHIYPGLIDAYSTVGITEIGSVDVSNDINEIGDFNPNVRAEVAVNAESRHIGTTRSAGVLVAFTHAGRWRDLRAVVGDVARGVDVGGDVDEGRGRAQRELARPERASASCAGGGGGPGGRGGRRLRRPRPTPSRCSRSRTGSREARAYRDAREGGPVRAHRRALRGDDPGARRRDPGGRGGRRRRADQRRASRGRKARGGEAGDPRRRATRCSSRRPSQGRERAGDPHVAPWRRPTGSTRATTTRTPRPASCTRPA